MDKELAGWPQSGNCGQWLCTQVEASNKWCPLGGSSDSMILISQTEGSLYLCTFTNMGSHDLHYLIQICRVIIRSLLEVEDL